MSYIRVNMGRVHRVKLDGERWRLWYLGVFKKELLQLLWKNILNEEGQKLIYKLRNNIDERENEFKENIKSYEKELEDYQNRRAKERDSSPQREGGANSE